MRDIDLAAAAAPASVIAAAPISIPDGAIATAEVAICFGPGRNGGGSECELGIFRYDASGALDASFGASGVAAFDPGNGCAEYHNIVLAPNGDIIAGGTLFGTSATVTRALRYSPAGVRDAAFDIA